MGKLTNIQNVCRFAESRVTSTTIPLLAESNTIQYKQDYKTATFEKPKLVHGLTCKAFVSCGSLALKFIDLKDFSLPKKRAFG